MNNGFFLQAIVYLTAALVCVPLAKRFGLGSVLGYLVAGILIGPFVMGFIGEEGKDIMHFAEFGVVMMLFLIGLELEPQKLWRSRHQIAGIGVSQVGATALIVFSLGLLLHLSWQAALAVALALSMSSTAIVLQSMKEKGLMRTEAGQNSFSVLLFQDISVIPILAILPVLSSHSSTGADPATGHSPLEAMPGWMQTLAVLLAVSIIILIGRYAIVPLLRVIAQTRLRELFTASSLLIVVSIAALMSLVGLSPALGTFLAGVILANSEFKHELESDLDPFKGLLLGLFFMAVGASINFHLIAANPGTVFALTAAIILVKAMVLWAIGKFSRMSTDQILLFAFGLSQVGEFAFVLLSFMGQLSLLSENDTDLLMAVTALSMTFTPMLLLLNDKILLPRIGVPEKTQAASDEIDEKHKVIIAGFSHFGSTVGRFLRANGVEATILDHDSDRVDLLRRMGFKVYYGDATRIDLLTSAGAEEAKILITAIDDPETNLLLVEGVKKHFPNLELMVRARNRYDAYELMDQGIQNIYRENLDTSIRLGVEVLKKLGYRSYSAVRAGHRFLRYDEEALAELSSTRHDIKTYITTVRRQIDLQEMLLKKDMKVHNSEDHAWDSELMRSGLQSTPLSEQK